MGCGIVQCGPSWCKTLRINNLDDSSDSDHCKLLTLMALCGWLAALDDFRNWLIREAA
jgi:hypothetical protein